MTIKEAIDLLKANGYRVIKAEKVTTLNSEMRTDLALTQTIEPPPASFYDDCLARYMSRELPKAWERTTKFEELERVDRATIWVIL